MPIDALAVANKILDVASEQGLEITPLQLQKLLYFVDGWHLEMYGQPMSTGHFQAWKFGPVHPKVYHEFKRFGSSKITGRAMDCFGPNGVQGQFKDHQIPLINNIVGIYGKLTGPQMSHLTHQSGTPWSKTWREGIGDGHDISTHLMLDEFTRLRQQYSDQ